MSQTQEAAAKYWHEEYVREHAKLRELQAEVERLREALQEVAALEQVLSAQVEQLLAERDRYREALGMILTIVTDGNRNFPVFEIAALAREALAVGGDPE